VLPELSYHIDIVFIIRKISRNTFLGYLEVYTQGLFSFILKVLLFISKFLSPLRLLSRFL
jgi:hypothetical protein